MDDLCRERLIESNDSVILINHNQCFPQNSELIMYCTA
jgi:hypothetical protein